MSLLRDVRDDMPPSEWPTQTASRMRSGTAQTDQPLPCFRSHGRALALSPKREGRGDRVPSIIEEKARAKLTKYALEFQGRGLDDVAIFDALAVGEAVRPAESATKRLAFMVDGDGLR